MTQYLKGNSPENRSIREDESEEKGKREGWEDGMKEAEREEGKKRLTILKLGKAFV